MRVTKTNDIKKKELLRTQGYLTKKMKSVTFSHGKDVHIHTHTYTLTHSLYLQKQHSPQCHFHHGREKRPTRPISAFAVLPASNTSPRYISLQTPQVPQEGVEPKTPLILKTKCWQNHLVYGRGKKDDESSSSS